MCVAPGCSTNNPRDISYGTDVALDFVPPDAAPKKDGTTTVEESGASVDGDGDIDDEDAKVLRDAKMAEVLTEVSLDGLQGETVSDPDAAITGVE